MPLSTVVIVFGSWVVLAILVLLGARGGDGR